jgi:hypothetical protein
MKPKQDNEYIDEGYRSYRSNKGVFKSPYKSSTKEYNLFERGWTQALKRAPEAFAKNLEKQRKPEAFNPRPTAEREIKPRSEFYKNRKGW